MKAVIKHTVPVRKVDVPRNMLILNYQNVGDRAEDLDSSEDSDVKKRFSIN